MIQLDYLSASQFEFDVGQGKRAASPHLSSTRLGQLLSCGKKVAAREAVMVESTGMWPPAPWVAAVSRRGEPTGG